MDFMNAEFNACKILIPLKCKNGMLRTEIDERLKLIFEAVDSLLVYICLCQPFNL